MGHQGPGKRGGETGWRELVSLWGFSTQSSHCTFSFQILPLLVFWAFDLYTRGEGHWVCQQACVLTSRQWGSACRACWENTGGEVGPSPRVQSLECSRPLESGGRDLCSSGPRKACRFLLMGLDLVPVGRAQAWVPGLLEWGTWVENSSG